MLSKSLRRILSCFVAAGLLLINACSANTQISASNDKTEPGVNDLAIMTGAIYSQPVNPNGTLLLSSWLDPDGSDYDQYIWDNFTLPLDRTITEINWFGVYDPLRFGAGGPVVDFSVSIYPSIAAGTEPAVANPPLVEYQTAGNAGETAIGTAGGSTLYAYAFILPTPFIASAGVKYWVQIEAFQQGSVPDWCLAAGSGGNGSHFRRTSGAGGDVLYRTAPGDAAFTLLGSIADIPTPTDTPTDTPTNSSTNTPTNTATNTPTNTPTDTPTATPTPTDTPTNTATNTSTYTPTNTPTNTSTDTPTNTATNTPTNTATYTRTYTPTFTSTPLSNTPGKVNGGGMIGSNKDGVKITFGFTINYSEGDSAPKGNLTYQDHQTDLRLKARSFDLLAIEGDHAWFTGTGITDDGQTVRFTVEINAPSKPGKPDTFYLYIPALNGYQAGGALTGGNITIH